MSDKALQYPRATLAADASASIMQFIRESSFTESTVEDTEEDTEVDTDEDQDDAAESDVFQGLDDAEEPDDGENAVEIELPGEEEEPNEDEEPDEDEELDDEEDPEPNAETEDTERPAKRRFVRFDLPLPTNNTGLAGFSKPRVAKPGSLKVRVKKARSRKSKLVAEAEKIPRRYQQNAEASSRPWPERYEARLEGRPWMDGPYTVAGKRDVIRMIEEQAQRAKDLVKLFGWPVPRGQVMDFEQQIRVELEVYERDHEMLMLDRLKEIIVGKLTEMLTGDGGPKLRALGLG